MHVDRVRLTGTERELRAENQSPPIFRPQNTLGDGANGLPLAVCTTTAHTCHTSHTHPSRWTPNPVPATKGVPAGLVQATFIIENLDPGNNDTPTPPTPKLRLARKPGHHRRSEYDADSVLRRKDTSRRCVQADDVRCVQLVQDPRRGRVELGGYRAELTVGRRAAVNCQRPQYGADGWPVRLGCGVGGAARGDQR
ncbi:Uncharacterised protein [Mycobacterium tuberculosis]|nr:Uncharacterised protein [Mycobacterium tuberculosis]COX03593.1 Uncharacterised protein [Mycobacterium tuberculosis]